MAEVATGRLAPGAVVGILGGGQLGRMLALAAARLGLRCHIFEPAANCPAAQVAEACTTAGWDDAQALARFAQAVDVLTYEFENVPVSAVEALASIRPVRPGPRALATAQDRIAEKSFLNGQRLPTAPWRQVDSLSDLVEAVSEIGVPAVLKTRRMGYDGKGQVRIEELAEATAAWEAVAGAPSILEGWVPFERELSVIAARGLAGAVVAFDPGENRHEAGILRETRVPAALRPGRAAEAVLMAGRLLSALDYIGVAGVEMFDTPDGLVVNEFAPRVHNSGHWTQLGCAVDQFEQHIRAVAGWPLGDGRRHVDVAMENLIGDDVQRADAIAAEAGAQLHLYGKSEIRAGRKMGHVNRIVTRPG